MIKITHLIKKIDVRISLSLLKKNSLGLFFGGIHTYITLPLKYLCLHKANKVAKLDNKQNNSISKR